MNFDELKSRLLREAHEAGICDEGYETLRECEDIDALLDFYTENPDWCIERDFPSPATLAQMWISFGGEMQHHGIYIYRSFEGEILTERQAYVMLHCKGAVKTGLNVERGIIPMFYFANGTDMKIGGANPEALIPSRVPLYISTGSSVRSKDGDGARFVKYQIKGIRR